MGKFKLVLRVFTTECLKSSFFISSVAIMLYKYPLEFYNWPLELYNYRLVYKDNQYRINLFSVDIKKSYRQSELRDDMN